MNYRFNTYDVIYSCNFYGVKTFRTTKSLFVRCLTVDRGSE